MTSKTTPLRARSCTPDPYLLNNARLHRVDASQLPHGAGVSLGHCRTDLPGGCNDDCEQGDRCTCTPDTKCAQHQHQSALFNKVWLGYIGVLLAVLGLALWPWLVL